MVGELTENSLGEIAHVQTGPFGSQLKNEQYITGGTPVITVEHINDFKIVDFDYPSVTEEDKNRLSKYLLKKGDIIFTRVGSVDLSAFVKPHQEGWMFSSRMLRVRPGKDIDSRYLSYYFQQPNFREYILNIAVGATMPSINTGILKGISITYPTIDVQKSIASILSSLDDKIDLLNRQNATLETMAETLFRQWFVAKAKEDWEMVTLEKIGKIICGKTPLKKVSEYFINGNIPFVKIPDMHGKTFVFDSEDNLTELGLNSQQNKTIPPKSICVSCIATVGLVVMNAKTSQTNQQINSIIPMKEIYRYFIYLKMISMKEDLLAMASGGTATDNLNTGNFSKISIQLPSDGELNVFHEKVSPLFEKIYNNQTQIHTLTSLRNTLLPKLMSGELRVEID